MGAFDGVIDDAINKLDKVFDKKSEAQIKQFMDLGNTLGRKLDRIIQLLEQR